MSLEELDNRFSYHSPDQVKAGLHSDVRSRLLDTATEFDDILPESREKSLAMTKLEEAMFWANAAIARNGVESA